MVCDEISMDDITTRVEAGRLLDSMWAVLKRENGWGLAAPQIGSPARLIVVHVKNEFGNGCKIEIINPVLDPVKRHGQFMSEERCLSWPGHSIRLKRYRQVKVRGVDRYGDPVCFGGKHNQAAALQHEIEHLDGINLADHKAQAA
jgi:peptide deformylase